MYHSIYIGDKNTWDDWHLIPSSRPLVAPPKVKTAYVDIPGGDGSLDLTSAMIGRPTYQNRTGSWEFYVDNEKSETWAELYSNIMNYLQGRSYKVVLEDDPKYYYEGQLSVNTWKSDKGFSKITIDYTFKPFKKIRRWSENNQNGIFDLSADEVVNENIKNYIYIHSDNGTPVNVELYAAADEIPEISSTMPNGVIGFTYKGVDYPLNFGINYIKEVKLDEGLNVLSFYSNANAGHVKIKVIGGCL